MLATQTSWKELSHGKAAGFFLRQWIDDGMRQGEMRMSTTLSDCSSVYFLTFH